MGWQDRLPWVRETLRIDARFPGPTPKPDVRFLGACDKSDSVRRSEQSRHFRRGVLAHLMHHVMGSLLADMA